jgi:pilus assembly protein CpaF
MDTLTPLPRAGAAAPEASTHPGEASGAAREPVRATGALYQTLKARLHNQLVDMLKPEEVSRIPEERRRVELRSVVEHLISSEAASLGYGDRRQMIEELLDESLGLGPLERLLKDPTVSDILVNGPREVWVERRGQLEKSEITFRDNAHLLQIIDRIVSKVGRRVDEASPMVDARLADGSRVNAIIPPVSLRGPAVSIRRFGVVPLKFKELLANRSVAPEMMHLLEGAVKARLNILVSGGTGSGKTTLLNALSGFIPANQRLVTIEDAAELQLQQPHVVQLETRPPNVEGKGQITMRDLVKNALRMRPDRIIVGEVRGPEVLDMLQAMNTGHEGSMTTLHANSPRDALGRMEMMILMAGMELPLKAMRQIIASSLNLIVQVDRMPGGARRVTSITEVVGMEGDMMVTQELFTFRQLGIDHSGRAHGQFEATGVRPHHEPKFRAASVALSGDMFQPRVLMTA